MEHAGVRQPKKRPGRSPDEKALRHAFVTFFAGAQWTADGCEVTAHVDGQPFSYNLELCVDTHSGAFVGLDVRDHENADALVSAFNEGKSETGAPPLALLLDHKPSNFAPAVDDALGDSTLSIAATKGRPQTKGHVEGAFGLFSQHAPPLVQDGLSSKQRARQLVELAARTFFGALNMRPRKCRNGRSRIDLYREADPTPDDVAQAKAALQARLDKQRKAAQTLRARQNPAIRKLLAQAFARLHLDDPKGHILDAIARYDYRYVADGVAIFDGKQTANTMPDGVDARYLLGIVKNTAEKQEGLAIAKALWDERIRARDILLQTLTNTLDETTRTHPESEDRLRAIVDLALDSASEFDRHFWVDTMAKLIATNPIREHRSMYDIATRRIHSTFSVPHHDRLQLTQDLANKLIPLA